MDKVFIFFYFYHYFMSFLACLIIVIQKQLRERHGMFWIPVIFYNHRHLIRSHEVSMNMTPDVSFLMYPAMHYFGTPRHT